jgi:hypothetical protein
MSEASENEHALALVENGAEIAGGAIGGAIGLIGGPAGVTLGAAGGVLAGKVFAHVGRELQLRLLGPRQHVRVGAAFAFAADQISARLLGGDELRDDGFFDRDHKGRCVAEETLEGVLITAGDAWEERKVKHIGWLYSSLAFDSSVEAADANHLLHLAERLSYRQLCSLAFLADPRPENALVSLTSVMGRPIVRTDAVNAELDEMAQALVIGFDDGGRIVPPSSTYDFAGFAGLDLIKVRVSALGLILHRLMRLDQISEEDILSVYADLGGSLTPRP